MSYSPLFAVISKRQPDAAHRHTRQVRVRGDKIRVRVGVRVRIREVGLG